MLSMLLQMTIFPSLRLSNIPLCVYIPHFLFCCCFFFVCLFLLFFFSAAPVAYEVSQARNKSELHLLAYATATTTQDLSHVCKLHHSSQQQQILNPLSEARDQIQQPHGSQLDLFLLHHNRNSFF